MDHDPPFRCFGCDAVLRERTRFCPQCGVRLDSGVTEPVWPGAADLSTVYTRERPRLIGVPPQDSILLLGALALVLGAVLLGVGVLLAGALALAAGLLLLAVFVQSFSRRPASTVARHTVTAYGLLRAQLAFHATAAVAWLRARAGGVRLNRQVTTLRKARRGHLLALGTAVYADDADGAEAARRALDGIDERVAATTAAIERLERRTAARIRAARVSRFRRVRQARLHAG